MIGGSFYLSGIYGFYCNINEENYLGLGSAISCKARLIDHMHSFTGSRTKQYKHKFITEHQGINNLTWSPLITSPNFVHNWNLEPISANMSLGRSKTLRGFAQFSLRVLEQSIMDKYTPSLNPNAQKNIYFFA